MDQSALACYEGGDGEEDEETERSGQGACKVEYLDGWL